VRHSLPRGVLLGNLVESAEDVVASVSPGNISKFLEQS
jgi:hypothetical protein